MNLQYPTFYSSQYFATYYRNDIITCIINISTHALVRSRIFPFSYRDWNPIKLFDVWCKLRAMSVPALCYNKGGFHMSMRCGRCPTFVLVFHLFRFIILSSSFERRQRHRYIHVLILVASLDRRGFH